MSRRLLYVVALLLCIVSCRETPNYTDSVLPSVGTAYNGHTFPGAILPFGMVSASPETGVGDWQHCSGYHYDDSSIIGFAQTHMSGTGANDMGDILLQPVTGAPKFEEGSLENPDSGYRSRFSHASEVIHPGYYSVNLDDYKVNCEVTVTDRCAFYRFTYPKALEAGIIFDMMHGNDSGVRDCMITYVDDRTVTGYRRSCGFVSDHTYYFCAKFSQPIIDTIAAYPGKLYVKLNPVKRVMVKLGLSTVSSEAAKVNLDAEIAGWNFEKVVKVADKKWNDQLSKINAQFANDDDKKVFYTALYHSLIVPNLITDVDGKYLGWDKQIHKSEIALYTNFSLWDTYRAVHPLYNIICPEQNVGFINSMLERYKQIGSLPINEYGTCETYCMIGYHAIPVIADAILQDMTGFDWELAYRAMLDIANDEHRGVGYYKNLGYIPSELENNSVSKVLEYAYDDWCISEVAKKLGKNKDATEFSKRAQNYKNIFDVESGGFTRGRYADGSWKTPFDPFKTSGLGNDDYTEGNAWQYTFYAPQDMTTYVEMNGGAEMFASKLDTMFLTPLDPKYNSVPDVSGLIGQYAHGNEPSHHTAYLYNFAGKPWKTQQMVARIRKEMYSSQPDGLCGNDDCGQMSAWYVFSVLGFYPVTPGAGYFVIGAPAVKEASIVMPNGRTFTVSAPNYNEDNIYIQSVKLNGEPYYNSFLSLADIKEGADVEFIMGSEPNADWGQAKENWPVSLIEY